MVSLNYTDNCDTSGMVLGVDGVQVGDSCGGTITRTWNITDACGNVAETRTQIITISDTQAPIIEASPADITVECIDDVPAMVSLNYTDNCDTSGMVLGVDGVQVGDSCGGTITRTWNITDACGNVAETRTQVITISDTQAPTFNETLPVDIATECDSVSTADTLTADDNCGTAVVVFTETRTDGSCANDYVLTRVWTATDECGLETVHTQIITVQDTTAPTLSNLPDDQITVVCGEIPEVAEITAEDNCSNDVDMIFTESETTTDDDGNYTITRDWLFTDECGNEVAFTQIINIESGLDIVTTQSLSICIDDLSIDLFTLLADGVDTNGTWSDIDVTGGLSGSNFDPKDVNLGEYLITYSYIEGCNSKVVEFTVDVNDDCIVLPCSLEDDGLYISKAVTPNGDSVNDTFVVGGELQEGCGFTYEVKIFNRWGQIVFESSNYQNDWDGLHTTGGITIGNTSDLPSGTYYYIVNVTDSGFKPFTGPIYLGK